MGATRARIGAAADELDEKLCDLAAGGAGFVANKIDDIRAASRILEALQRLVREICDKFQYAICDRVLRRIHRFENPPAVTGRAGVKHDLARSVADQLQAANKALQFTENSCLLTHLKHSVDPLCRFRRVNIGRAA